jgi:hypothetical protein
LRRGRLWMCSRTRRAFFVIFSFSRGLCANSCVCCHLDSSRYGHVCCNLHG